jgi:hypothetical protein
VNRPANDAIAESIIDPNVSSAVLIFNIGFLTAESEIAPKVSAAVLFLEVGCLVTLSDIALIVSDEVRLIDIFLTAESVIPESVSEAVRNKDKA